MQCIHILFIYLFLLHLIGNTNLVKDNEWNNHKGIPYGKTPITYPQETGRQQDTNRFPFLK